VYPPKIGLAYAALGLAGEAGEVANKVKKVYRDADGVLSDEARDALSDELGDVLWYVAAVATELGLSLNAVAEANLDKLARRQRLGRLQGSGDAR
jgi:NTP pyrophosphatase (non-canonical NTP hydrolase)